MKLVGRDEELAALACSIGPLVTLWGPGGAGKTALARAEAERRRARGDVVVWLDLASARTRAEVATAIALALGLDATSADDVLHAAATSATFYVADNVEQVEPEGRALVVALARERRVLVTSRDALGAPAEETIEVRPLDEAAAARLYTRLTNTPEDDVVREIVRRLDALPLAIELAAARAPLLGNEELLARLDRKLDVLKDTGKDPRHATLRAAIAWSWELLGEGERRALVVCAHFAAPFEARLAEAALGDDALDELEGLRRRALVQVDPHHRLFLLEAVRDFVRDRASAADDALRSWADAVLAFAEPLALRVRRGEPIDPALERRRPDLQRVFDTRGLARSTRLRAFVALAALRAVTGYGPDDVAVEIADPAAGALEARAALAVALALRAAGRLGEAEAIASAALRAEEAAPSAGRDAGDVFRVAGVIARSGGDVGRAVTLLERALAAYRAAGEEALAGITLGELGVATQSDERLAEGIAVLVAAKSLRAEGLFRSHLAVTTHRRGEARASLPLHEAALEIHRRAGSRRLEGAELLHRGFVLHEIGELDGARASIEDARRLLALAGARGLEAFASVLLARLLVDGARGKDGADFVEARVALAEAARIAPTGWPRLEATRLVVSGHLAFAAGDRAAAAAAYGAALAASEDVEVGFEALTPAYRAVAAGAPAPPAPAFRHPHLAVAFALLTGAATIAPPEAIAASSEVRRALAFTAARRALVVTATGVVLPDGRTIDLGRRKNLRLIARALARGGGDPVAPDALIAAGWPGERMRAEAATKRLHTAIWTLRRLGLEGVLLSSDAGYWLDRALAVELRE